MSERAWAKAREAVQDIDEAVECMKLLALDMSMPSAAVNSMTWQDAVHYIMAAREKVNAVCSMLAEYRADGEPFKVEKEE